MNKLQVFILTIIIALVVVGAGYGFVSSLPFWQIESILVLDNKNISEEDIIEASGIDLGKTGLLKISSSQINQRVTKKIDQIKSITLKKKFPDRLIIKVVLRKPIVKVYIRNTSVCFDSEGVLITHYYNVVPLLVDAPTNQQELKLKITKHSILLTELEQLNPSMNIAIYELSDSKLQFRINDTNIIFGDLKQSHLKLEYLKILIDNIDINRLEYIDLRVPTNIAVKRR